MSRMIVAFVCGMLVSVAAILPHGAGPAAEDGAAPLYYDMGTAHVQFSDEECGTRALAVSYQLAYGAEDRTSYITAFKPKLEAAMFAALSDHLNETGNTRTGAVKRIMAAAVVDALGPDVVSDVLITEMQELGA